MKQVIVTTLLTSLAAAGYSTYAHALDLTILRDVIQSNTTSAATNAGNASSLRYLSDAEANGGLKEALSQGVSKAVNSLGVADGFFGNNAVKIRLPSSLQKIQKGMKLMGMGKRSDELVLKMNRVAEAAVPEAKTLLVESIKKMTLADAQSILTGPQDAATQYFKKTTSAQMSEKFLPIVTKATQNVALADSYNKYASMGSKFGLLKKEDANINQYVTNKALDAVYYMVAQEETAIRKDPLGQASILLKKVFGSIGK